MRVIAGEARGRRLKTAPGRSVRPTADRVREALFSILGDRVAGARFLDLYAGSGAVGIEALSRGAERAVFVETAGGALEALRWNLERCGFAGRAKVLVTPVAKALSADLLEEASFALAFMDPPYDARGEAERALAMLVGPGGPLARDGLAIVEHRGRDGGPGAPPGLVRERTARYGDTAVSF